MRLVIGVAIATPLALLGCLPSETPLGSAGAVSVMPSPSAANPSPAMSSFPTPSPFILPDPTTFLTEITPAGTCVGVPTRLTGREFQGATHVRLRLEGEAPRTEGTNGGGPPRLVDPPLGVGPRFVTLGEATVGADGRFTLDFVIPATAKTDDGLGVLLPGHFPDYWANTLRLLTDAPGHEEIALSLDGSSPCPPRSSTGEEVASIRLEPENPCAGTTTTVVGRAFKQPSVKLQFHRGATRFLTGPAVVVTVPVLSDGTFRYAFDPGAIGTGASAMAFDSDSYNEIRAYDEYHSLNVHVPVAMCEPNLPAAVHASSVPLGPSVQGVSNLFMDHEHYDDWHGPLVQRIIQSPADLASAARDLGLDDKTLALFPSVDYASQTGLLVGGRFEDPASVEITAVEPMGGELVVRSVYWRVYFMSINTRLFHFRTIARTNRPIRFAPMARGFSSDRSDWLGDRAVAYPRIRSEGGEPVLESNP